MYLENCTQIVFLKRKATSDFYDKKELRLNISILPIASRKTNMSFTHTPNVLYARKNRRQPSLSVYEEMDIQRSSEEGRRADALALRADERRDKLR